MAGPFTTVVLPGVAGTQLSYKGGQGGKTVLWLNKALLLSQSPLSLALDTDGKSPYPFFGKTLFPDGPVGLGIYEPLLSHLANRALSPTFYGYDWRLDIFGLAQAFVTALASMPLSNPFYVVAHSMGGLLAQLAYPLWVANGNSPTWQKTVFMATPSGGSHWATMMLNGIYGNYAWLNLLAKVYGVLALTNPVVLVTGSAVTKIMSTALNSWPAIYQLVPSDVGTFAGLDPLAGLALLPSTYEPSPSPINQQWLATALPFQNRINAGLSGPRPQEAVVVGLGNATPYKFVPGADYGYMSGFYATDNGDGTVPLVRVQRPAPVTTFQVQGGTHNGLCTSFVSLDAVADWLLDTTDALELTDEPLKPPVFIDSPRPGPLPLLTWAGQFANKTQDP